MLWHKLPKSIYSRRGPLSIALDEMITDDHKRALIVINRFLSNSDYVDQITPVSKTAGVGAGILFEVEADPTLSIVRKSAELASSLKPDVIIALDDGPPTDAAKIMWVMHEHSETHFGELALCFMDIRKRIYKSPKMGAKARMTVVTTASNAGSEVTPLAVVTDDTTDQRYPLVDYTLVLDVAIVDTNLVTDMSKSLCAFGDLDAVAHAMEAYVSILASGSSDDQALQALKLLEECLPASYYEGSRNPVVRERVHSVATIAIVAFANAFLGVCHPMAHELDSQFRIPHGLANALLICNVIRYNASDNPTKQAALNQYDRPQARHRCAEVADHLGLNAPDDRTAAKIEKLPAQLETLRAELGIPESTREAGVQEADFLTNVDRLSENASDDQCTGTNPCYPLIFKLERILLDTCYGHDYVEDETTAKEEAVPTRAEKRAEKPT